MPHCLGFTKLTSIPPRLICHAARAETVHREICIPAGQEPLWLSIKVLKPKDIQNSKFRSDPFNH